MEILCCNRALLLKYTNKMTTRTSRLLKNLALHSVLSASLFTPALMAQEFPPTDRQHRQSMSYEEYSAHREKMRLRMEKKHTEEGTHSSDKQKSDFDHTDKAHPDSAYGQGFHTRNRLEDKHDTARANRQDHPRLERTIRGDRMRR